MRESDTEREIQAEGAQKHTCYTMDSSSSSLPVMAATTAGAAAAMTLATLGILQTDYFSRKYLLSPLRLQLKRCQTYNYTWKHKIIEYTTKFQLNYFLVGGSKDNISDYNNNPKILDQNYTEYISSKDKDGMKKFIIDKILNKKSPHTYRIVKIDQDVDDPTNEYYLYLMEEEKKKEDGAVNTSYDVTKLVMYQVPLIDFCSLLKEELDNIISTITFCFVADASSNRGYDFIYDLCEKSSTLNCNNFQIGLVKEPLWLLTMGSIIDDRSILNKQIIENILYCCCRLESLRLNDVVKQSKTVVMTLSGGQAMTHILLPYIYKVFPQDRHVFTYDSCTSSVQRAIHTKKTKYKQGGILPTTVDDATSIKGNSPMTMSTPYYSTTSIQLIKSSVVYKTRLLLSALQKLSIQHASIVECWITSVDTFLKLKEDYGDENKKIQCPYLPFVLQWNQIIDRKNLTSYLGNAPNITNEDDKKCDTYWMVRSLIQYITGCKSRPLPDGILETAMSHVLLNVIPNEEQQQQDAAAYCKLSKQQLKDIENCCFQHKSILIENKTLPDTVYPKQHWTLKQNLKRGGGCACCGPEDYLNDDEEEEEEQGDVDGANGFGGSTKPSSTSMMRDDGTLDMSVPGAFAMAFQPQQQQASGSTLTNRRRGGGGSGGSGDDVGTNKNGTAGVASSSDTEANKRPKFVDGKLGFAFDPTKFS